jgi:hypothetical protein
MRFFVSVSLTLVVADAYPRWQWKYVSHKDPVGIDPSVGRSVPAYADDAF